MKKVALILVFLLVISSAFNAFASEGIDFSTLSTEDLIRLKTQINEEIAKRAKDEKPVYVPMGEYIVGYDIPERIYTIKNTGTYCVIIKILSAEGECIKTYTVYKGEYIGKIELQKYQRITIEYGGVSFYSYQGLGF